MSLVRTLSLLETAERHVSAISDTNLDKQEIASYLGRVAAITFYAEMEQQVRAVFSDRLQGVADQKLKTFILRTNDGMLRRMKRKELAESVSLFGEDCGITFKATISDADYSVYSNVINDRHETSHGEGAAVTLSEVRSAVRVAEGILVAVQASIA